MRGLTREEESERSMKSGSGSEELEIN